MLAVASKHLTLTQPTANALSKYPVATRSRHDRKQEMRPNNYKMERASIGGIVSILSQRLLVQILLAASSQASADRIGLPGMNLPAETIVR
jgi:hypothetical protein